MHTPVYYNLCHVVSKCVDYYFHTYRRKLEGRLVLISSSASILLEVSLLCFSYLHFTYVFSFSFYLLSFGLECGCRKLMNSVN